MAAYGNCVFGSSYSDDFYGPGIDPATGTAVAPDAGILRLRLSDGSYDSNNRQIGVPFQAQFGVQFFF